MDMPALTGSEMSQWMYCHRGWWISYWLRLRKKHDLPSLPDIGTMFHLALQRYYETDREVNPLDVIRDYGIKLIEENPELAEQIARDAEMAGIMVEGYVPWTEEEGLDAGLTFLSAEQEISVPVGPYTLRGKIDSRYHREWGDRVIQREYKTVGGLNDIPKYAQSSMQFRNYNMLSLMSDELQSDALEVVMARRVKRTARAKPPFYGRHIVQHSRVELRAHYRHVIAIGREIEGARAALAAGAEHHDVCPPNAGNRDHRWRCPCDLVTNLIDDGSDWQGFLEEFYEEHDPWARYAPGGEEDES